MASEQWVRRWGGGGAGFLQGACQARVVCQENKGGGGGWIKQVSLNWCFRLLS